MSTGLSLHIGLNAVNPAHYGGWSGPLNACEADAEDLRTVAVSQGFEPTLLKTSEATRDRVRAVIAAAAADAREGDIFFLSYSGHGGQVPDRSGDEQDLQDET